MTTRFFLLKQYASNYESIHHKLFYSAARYNRGNWMLGDGKGSYFQALSRFADTVLNMIIRKEHGYDRWTERYPIFFLYVARLDKSLLSISGFNMKNVIAYINMKMRLDIAI